MANIFDIPPLYHQLCNPVKACARLLDFAAERLRLDQQIHKNIRVVCMSDTHTLIPDEEVPYGDILIHAGDLANNGTVDEIQAQIDWLDGLPHRYKIVIAGNHDTYLDPQSRKTLHKSLQKARLDWKGITYLQDGVAELDFSNRIATSGSGKIKVYGLPHIPACGGPEFAFQYPRGTDIWSGRVPIDVDILVTHTPPKYHLDLPSWSCLGDEHLLREVRRTKPLLHVFGHVHAGRSELLGRLRGGQEVVRWDLCEKHLEKILSRRSATSLILGWLDVYGFFLLAVAVVLHLSALLRDIRGQETPATRLVNASLMYRNTGRLRNSIQVVHL